MPGANVRLLITNAIVVTMNDANDVHFDGAVAVEGDRIAAVGPSSDVVARFREGAHILDAADAPLDGHQGKRGASAEQSRQRQATTRTENP